MIINADMFREKTSETTMMRTLAIVKVMVQNLQRRRIVLVHLRALFGSFRQPTEEEQKIFNTIYGKQRID